MATVIQMRGTKEAPKNLRSSMETIIFTPKEVEKWGTPIFQRPTQANEKVLRLAEDLKQNGGLLPGILTLGKWDSKTWTIDGLHRLKAFEISGLSEAIADVRIIFPDSFAELAREFVVLNSRLRVMRPDDVLRGSESWTPALKDIRRSCPYVGYDSIRRNDKSPILSMSQVLRCWWASSGDVPALGGMAASDIAQALDKESVDGLVAFLGTAYEAWGREPAYTRMWASLNMTLCMWMWRALVLNKERGVKRYVVLSDDDFKKCLMSVSANGNYNDWLANRRLSERDRGPGYNRLRTIFTKRLMDEGHKACRMPVVEWASIGGNAAPGAGRRRGGGYDSVKQSA